MTNVKYIRFHVCLIWQSLSYISTGIFSNLKCVMISLWNDFNERIYLKYTNTTFLMTYDISTLPSLYKVFNLRPIIHQLQFLKLGGIYENCKPYYRLL